MDKANVLRGLDTIKDMSDEEIAINGRWIREVATAAYSLLKQRYPQETGKPKEGDEA